jgi:hypothetical protein
MNHMPMITMGAACSAAVVVTSILLTVSRASDMVGMLLIPAGLDCSALSCELRKRENRCGAIDIRGQP